MKRAVAYIRVSTEEQATEGFSLEAQEDQLRAYCKLRNYDLVELIPDRGVSASRNLESRGGGKLLLELLADESIDVVVAVKLDRLFRNARDCLNVTEQWDKSGVALHLLNLGGQMLDTSSTMGRFFLVVMAGVAEMESSMIAERTRDGLRKKKEKGLRVGRIPFGYQLRTTPSGMPTDELEKSAEEQRIIRLVHRLNHRGWSQRRIAEHLNKRGDYTRGRKGQRSEWHQSSISRLLKRA